MRIVHLARLLVVGIWRVRAHGGSSRVGPSLAGHFNVEDATSNKDNKENTEEGVSEGRGGAGEGGAVDAVQRFSPNASCPYAISTEEEAYARGRDPAVGGNVLVVKSFDFVFRGGHVGIGNYFTTASINLSLGFCCKSKLVLLPPKDGVLSPGILHKGTPGPRYFDFSSAPDVEGFDSSTCPSKIRWSGHEAFHLTGLMKKKHRYYNPGLQKCVENLPPLIGCEAAYLFPTDIEICPTEGRTGGEERGREDEKVAGNLVIHVRSGDIFAGTKAKGYGQPPLQYYLRVIEDQEWDRIDIVTNGLSDERHALNPVVPALEAKVADGALPSNIHFHKNHTLAEDLVSMLCADAIMTAKSTWQALFAHQSRATRIYMPHDCRLPRIRKDAGPGVKVFGMVWQEEDYTVYDGWQDTADQRAEMLTFNVTGVEECNGSLDLNASTGGVKLQNNFLV